MKTELEWINGPQEGGENEWADGDLILAVVKLASGASDVFCARVSCDCGTCDMTYADTGDYTGWNLIDISHYTILNNKLPK